MRLPTDVVCSRPARPGQAKMPDGVWDALPADTTRADDLAAIARSATYRGRYPRAEALHREAAADGDPVARRDEQEKGGAEGEERHLSSRRSMGSVTWAQKGLEALIVKPMSEIS